MSAWISLGKHGDILNLLPLLWAEAQNGTRPTLVVAKEFAGQISEGCSYFDELVFDGEPAEIRKAYDFARKSFDDKDIVITQIVGKPEDAKWVYSRIGATKAQTESFAKEAYLLAGRLNDWGKFPLAFDRRDEKRERKLIAEAVTGEKPVMLVSAGGTTSPFPHQELLLEMLSLKFPQFQLVDLSKIQAHRIYDLLGLYEHACLLVATDSAPLHLAYGCPSLPVVALVNDKPILWNGSPWRPNHIAHIRYNDFTARILDMWRAIEGAWNPGSPFCLALTKETRLIHVWNKYEIDDHEKHTEAAKTWRLEYETNRWISCPAEPGIFGRDSKSTMNSEKRIPFLRDAIRMGSQRARDEDIIVISRWDTCMEPGLTEKIMVSAPCYAHRRSLTQDTHNPAVDLFAFSKAWWKEQREKVPDFVFGNDQHWGKVLVELLKSTKATELKEAVYRT